MTVLHCDTSSWWLVAQYWGGKVKIMRRTVDCVTESVKYKLYNIEEEGRDGSWEPGQTLITREESWRQKVSYRLQRWRLQIVRQRQSISWTSSRDLISGQSDRGGVQLQPRPGPRHGEQEQLHSHLLRARQYLQPPGVPTPPASSQWVLWWHVSLTSTQSFYSH